MEQLEELRRKRESAQDLFSVVKTMKSLAAVNIREYEAAAESLEDYVRSIELGLQIAMRRRQRHLRWTHSEEQGTVGAVIFGSEQGMVGQFNEQIAVFAQRKLDELQIDPERRIVMALGDKLIGRLESLGVTVDEGISVFGSMVDIDEINQELLIRIEEWRLEKDVRRILLFHNRQVSGTRYEQTMHSLLPISEHWLNGLADEDWPTNMLPTHYSAWPDLFSALLREYFFVLLYRASVESLASENASRLASMQSAEKNIQERLEDLDTRYQHVRQESITGELLDIVSGFEVLSSS